MSLYFHPFDNPLGKKNLVVLGCSGWRYGVALV